MESLEREDEPMCPDQAEALWDDELLDGSLLSKEELIDEGLLSLLEDSD